MRISIDKNILKFKTSSKILVEDIYYLFLKISFQDSFPKFNSIE